MKKIIRVKLILLMSLCAYTAHCKSVEPSFGSVEEATTPSTTITVNSSEQFIKLSQQTIEEGTIIEFADGEYRDLNLGNVALNIKANGTKESPVIIRAKNKTNPRVYITGASAFIFRGDNIQLRDLYFHKIKATAPYKGTDKTSMIVAFYGNYNKLINCVLDSRYSREGFLTTFRGYGNEVAHNTFYDSARGAQVFMDVRHGDSVPASEFSIDKVEGLYSDPLPRFGLPVGGNHIHHNYFYNPKTNVAGATKTGNGQSPIRTGSGEICYAYTLIENNLFDDCNAEGEIITMKGKHTLVRHNTFNNSARLTFRHTSNSLAYGNFFIGGENGPECGISVWGNNNQIVNNYFENTSNPIALVAGWDVATFKTLKDFHITHIPVKNLLIANNSFFNIDGTVINLGLKYHYPDRCELPTDVKFVNNVVASQSGAKSNVVGLSDGVPKKAVEKAFSSFANNVIPKKSVDSRLEKGNVVSDCEVKTVSLAGDNRYCCVKDLESVKRDIPLLHTMRGKGGEVDALWDNQDVNFTFDIFGNARNTDSIKVGAIEDMKLSGASAMTMRKLTVSDLGSTIGATMPLIDKLK